MNRFHLSFGWLVLLLGTLHAQSPSPAPPANAAEPTPPGLHFTLTDAEAFALKNHPAIRAASFTAESVSQQIREARANLFPQVYGEANAVFAPSNTRLAALGGLNNPSIYSRQSDGLVINQLITDFGKTFDLVQAAKSSSLAARARVRTIQNLVLIQVDTAYFGVLKADALLRVAEITVSARQLVYDRVDALMKHQLKSSLDLSFAQVDLDQAKLDRVEAVNNINQAENQLSTAMGFPDPQRFVLTTPPLNLQIPSSDENLRQLAVENRPEIAALRDDAFAAIQTANAARKAQYPTVSAIADGGLNPKYNPKGLSQHYWAAGLTVEVPIANGGRLDARVQEALLQADAAQQRELDTENTITRDVRQVFLNLETDKARLSIVQDLLKSASDAQRLANTRYTLGTSSIIELSQAQLNYTQALVQDSTAQLTLQLDQELSNLTTGTKVPPTDSAPQAKTTAP